MDSYESGAKKPEAYSLEYVEDFFAPRRLVTASPQPGRELLRMRNGLRRGATRRMFKKAVQRGRSERRGEACCVLYVEPQRDARTKLADFFNILLRTETGEEGRQLHRQAHVTADTEATGHGDHRAADLAVQHTETIFTRHGQRDIRVRMSALRHLAGPIPDLHEILPPVGTVQIELVDHIQSLGRLRVQLAGERIKEGPNRFGL